VPTGWNPVEKDNVMLLVAPAPLPGTTTYIVLAAEDLHGGLQQAFDGFMTGFQKTYRILQGGVVTPMQSNKGYDAYTTTMAAIDQNGKRWNVYVAGISYEKRIQMVMFWSDISSSSTYDIYFQKFKSFLEDVNFEDTASTQKLPSDPPQPVPSTSSQLPAGRLQGVYVCIGDGAGRPSNKQYLFYPDGFMVYGLPQEGMLDFDFEHYRSENNRAKNWVGRYKVDGDTVKIVWQNEYGDPARPSEAKINETSASPPWDQGWDTYIPMCLCTGKRFSGRYRLGAPGADQYLDFFADGTFIDHRATDQMIVPSPFYEHPRIQRGTYSIQSQTIIFNFADGHRGTRTFVAPKVQENQLKFDWIGLGWQRLFEEDFAEKLAR
jgi:hypothetical protein